MPLLVSSVEIVDFRSYAKKKVALHPELTILVGPNAAGKTNIIEAIELLTAASSFKKPLWGDTVRWGEDEARLTLDASGSGRDVKISLAITKAGARRYAVNNKAKRALSDVVGILPCVAFTPDDLRLVKDSAERRRSSLDGLGVQLSKPYAQLKREYEKALRQRNRALRDGVGEASMEALTDILIDKGARLVKHRKRLFSRLREKLTNIHSIVSGQALEARYLPSWERDGMAAEGDEEMVMREHLEAKREDEERRQTTLSGPHRDDFVFEIEGRDARVFGSQGQQRTIALCLKLAEVDVVTDITKQPPILLLDDVMSELDETRRHLLTAYVGTAAQTVVTTTNVDYFDPSLLGRAKVVRIQ